MSIQLPTGYVALEAPVYWHIYQVLDSACHDNRRVAQATWAQSSHCFDVEQAHAQTNEHCPAGALEPRSQRRGVHALTKAVGGEAVERVHQADDQRHAQVHRYELAEDRPPGLEELRQEGAEEHQGLGVAG